MKTPTLVLIPLLALAATCAGRAAQPFRTDINPALQYYQALIAAPDLPQADRDYLFSQNWRGKTLPDRLGQLLKSYDNQFRLVVQAAHSTVPCDWGIDMSPGPATLLPHLGRVRAITQTARLRTMWLAQSGPGPDALDDLLAAFVLARNASRDGTLISDLVQIAGENAVCTTVAENFSQLSPAALTSLLEGIDAAPPRRTVAACMPMEKAFFLDWFLAKIQDLQRQFPNDDAKVMAGIRDVFASFEGPQEGPTPANRPDHWKRLLELSGGTSAGVVQLLRDVEPLYVRAERVLSLPAAEYEPAVTQFTTEIEQARNPFVSVTFPALTKCRPKEFAIEAELAMLRAAVAYKRQGEAALRSVPDPLGAGPFQFQRFVFEGVDRGFKLQSAYNGRGFPEVLIFVETPGAPFQVNGKDAGQPLPK